MEHDTDVALSLNQQRGVDKIRLAEAVNKLRDEKTRSVGFACGKQMLTHEIALQSIHLKEIGDIQIPVSLQVRLLNIGTCPIIPVNNAR